MKLVMNNKGLKLMYNASQGIYNGIYAYIMHIQCNI